MENTITLLGGVGTFDKKMANRFKFFNDYLQKQQRRSFDTEYIATLGAYGPYINEIIRSSFLSQIYFDLMDISENIFGNYVSRIVQADIMNQVGMDLWKSTMLPHGKDGMVTTETQCRERISQSRLALWKHYKFMFFSLRHPMFLKALDHVIRDRSPFIFFGQSFQYGHPEVEFNFLGSAEERDLLDHCRIQHFCGLPPKVVDTDFEFPDSGSVNIFDDFVVGVDKLALTMSQFVVFLTSRAWIDQLPENITADLDKIEHALASWENSDVDLLSINIWDVCEIFQQITSYLFHHYYVEETVIAGIDPSTPAADELHFELLKCITSLKLYMHVIRSSHVWIFLGFGSHPDTHFHVLNPCGYWIDSTTYIESQTPQRWLQTFTWESVGAYIKLGWVIINEVHESVPYTKQCDKLTLNTSWQTDKTCIIDNEVSILM
jgi:hypothetical protein